MKTSILREAAPMPLDPRLRRLSAMGVRWAEEPEPTGSAPKENNAGDDGDGDGDGKAGTHEDAAEFVKAGGKKAAEAAPSQSVSKKDFDALQARYDELQRKHETADEKAVRERVDQAKAEARKEAADQYAATLLRTLIRSKNPDVSDSDLEEFVEETNFAAFVTDDGVDENKLLRRAERAAGNTTRSPEPDFGQGNRGGSPSKSGVQAGYDLYDKHYGKG